jgi:RNA polymerase sigma factor (sigma-70 family)
MTNPFNNDHDILSALQSADPKNVNAALKHLLQSEKLRSFIRQQVFALGGKDEDVRELMHEALIVFLNRVEEKKYDPALSGIATYVVRIAAQMYHTKRRSEFRRVSMYDRSVEAGNIETSTDPEESYDVEHRREVLDRILSMIGDKCRQLLRLHGSSFSMAEIAAQFGYKTSDVAKMAVQDCRKKLNQLLAQRPELLAELREI